MRILCSLLFCACMLTAAPTADEIMRKSCERESHNVELRKQYTYRQTDEVRKVEKNGSFRDRKQRSFEVLYIDGTEYRRLVEKDGKPLPEKEAKEEQAKMDREIDKRKRESESSRRKRREKDQKELAEERQTRLEVPKAYDFSLQGDEVVNGRPCWKIAAEPKKGYKPGGGNAKFLPKLHGTVWVDKENYEWAKIDAESLETISAGLGLFRVGKGFRLQLEQAYINNEIWAPVTVNIKANARAMLFVGGNFDVAITFRDYRKYSVSSTVTMASESNP